MSVKPDSAATLSFWVVPTAQLKYVFVGSKWSKKLSSKIVKLKVSPEREIWYYKECKTGIGLSFFFLFGELVVSKASENIWGRKDPWCQSHIKMSN